MTKKLKQKKQAPKIVRAGQMRSRSAPVAQGYKNIRVAFDVKPGNKPGSIRVRGTEYVGRISSSSIESDLLLNMPLNPSCFPGRLAQYARLFDKYIFHELTVHYAAACPTTLPGSLAMMFDGDPADDPPANPAEMLGLPGCQTKLWQDSSFRVPTLDQSREYFMGLGGVDQASTRLISQGQVFVMQFVAVPGETESEVGDVFVQYDCTLHEPVLHPPEMPAVIGPNDYEGTDTYTIPEESNQPSGSHKYYLFKDELYWQRIAENIVSTASDTLQQYIDGNGKRWLKQILDTRIPPTITAALFAAGQPATPALPSSQAGVKTKLSAYSVDMTVRWDVNVAWTNPATTSSGFAPIMSSYEFATTISDTAPIAYTFGALNVDTQHAYHKAPNGSISTERPHNFASGTPGEFCILIAPYISGTENSGTYSATAFQIDESSQRLLVSGTGHLAIETNSPSAKPSKDEAEGATDRESKTPKARQ